MKFIVLGATSFSGAAFCGHLHAHGHSVIELSRRRGGDINYSGTPDAITHWVQEGFDTIVNFIALNMVGESWDHAPDYYQTNVVATARLADTLRSVGLKKFVQVSTPEVYGTTQTFLKEGAAFNPTTPYAISRAAGDMHLQALHRQYGFPVCFTRTVNVYGPGQQLYRIIPKTIMCILTGRTLLLHGGGHSTRSFIHIRDVSEAVYRVATKGHAGETYHVATGAQTSIRALVERICSKLGADFADCVEDTEERPGKDMAYQLDDSKIRNELGWCDTISLEHGLDETIGWIKQHFDKLKSGSIEYTHQPVRETAACA